MYRDTNTGAYPLTLQQVREALPNTCLGELPTPDQLAPLGFVQVMPTAKPERPGMAITEGRPELDGDGVWRQTWIETPLAADELAAAFEAARVLTVAGINADRDTLLAIGAPFGGKRIEVTDKGRADLAGLTLAAILAQTDPSAWSAGYAAGWIAMDNTRIPLPAPADGIALSTGVAAWYAGVIQTARTAKDAALAVVFHPQDPAASEAALQACRATVPWPG